jgi:hypothetical protein
MLNRTNMAKAVLGVLLPFAELVFPAPPSVLLGLVVSPVALYACSVAKR